MPALRSFEVIMEWLQGLWTQLLGEFGRRRGDQMEALGFHTCHHAIDFIPDHSMLQYYPNIKVLEIGLACLMQSTVKGSFSAKHLIDALPRSLMDLIVWMPEEHGRKLQEPGVFSLQHTNSIDVLAITATVFADFLSTQPHRCPNLKRIEARYLDREVDEAEHLPLTKALHFVAKLCDELHLGFKAKGAYAYLGSMRLWNSKRFTREGLLVKESDFNVEKLDAECGHLTFQ